jgi:hypothetical protein
MSEMGNALFSTGVALSAPGSASGVMHDAT